MADLEVEPSAIGDPVVPEKLYVQERSNICVLPKIRQLCEAELRMGELEMQDNLPIVGLVVSGGGERASLATLAFIAALKDTELLDCALYAAGLSGGSWGLGTILANLRFRPERSIFDIKNELKDRFRFDLSDTSQYNKEALFRVLDRKKTAKQFYGFADIWGHAFLERHLGGIAGFENIKFSGILPQDARSFPLPIFTAAIDVSLAGCCCRCKHKYEALEFTPYCVKSDFLGCCIPMREFNSVFERGFLLDAKPEPSLGYIFGICGSAYSLSPHDMMQYVKEALAKKSGGDKGIVANEIWNSFKTGRVCPPLVYNFARGLQNQAVGDDPYLALIDGAFINSGVEKVTDCVNLPLYPILQRKAGVIVVLDASDSAASGECLQLRNAFAFAAAHGFNNLPPMIPFKESVNYKIFGIPGQPEVPTIIYIYNGVSFRTTKFAYTSEEIDQLFDFVYQITTGASDDIKEAIKTRSLRFI